MTTPYPRLERDPVRLPEAGEPTTDLWVALFSLADRLVAVPWTIVGGQMVLLHALESGVVPVRLSTDLDAAVDVRTDPRAMRKVMAAVLDLGFVTTGTSPEGIAHRFERDTESGTTLIDILVPEGLGPRTDITTVPPGRAFAAAGVSQALQRTQLLPVRFAGATSWLPRPDLLGAIVAKAVAATVDGHDTDRHLFDLAFLASLLDDPFSTAQRTTATDRRRLRNARRKLTADHPLWRRVPRPNDARSALEILASNPGRAKTTPESPTARRPSP